MNEGSRGILTGIKAGLLFMGTVIGAGFASGKEILTFFAGGVVSLLFSVITAGIFFYLTGLLFFNLGRRTPSGSLYSITRVLLKKYGNVFNMFLAFCYLVLLAAMLAGADALARESLGYRGQIPVFSLIMLLTAVFVTDKGIRGLLKVNSVLVPAVVIFILTVCFFSLSKITSSDSGSWTDKGMGFFQSIYSSVLYVSMNMLLSSAVLISAGKDMNDRQIKTASITAAAIITLMLVLVLLACRFSYSEIQGMEMPMVILSLKISPVFGIITLIMLSFAIFTTLISSLYPLKEYFKDFIGNKKTLYTVLILSGFLLSRIGFTYIIKYIYPIQGIIGVAFIAFCAAYDANTVRALKPLKFKKINQKIK